MKKYKVIFAGTSDFAVPSLKALSEADFANLELAITQPDKPVGRKKELAPSPIKILSQDLGLNLAQPEKIIELRDKLKELQPDIGIVVSYGQIIPQDILDIPKHGWLNLHPSKLPKYRGPSPLQNTILNQDTQTAVSLMLLDDKMDHGPVLAQKDFEIKEKYTTPELSKILSQLGAEILIENLANYLEGNLKPQIQDDSQATFTKIINKSDGQIDWTQTASQIEAQLRAYTPWPGIFTFLDDKRLKIISVKETNLDAKNYEPGQILIQNNQFFVACRDKFLEILTLQLEGKKEVPADSFIQGNSEVANSKLTKK